MRVIADSIFLLLALFFWSCWIITWPVFHMAGAVIYILLILAVISLAVHVVRNHQPT